MLDKVRIPHGRKKLNAKTVVAYILFGAIILVFVFFGLNKAGPGGSTENAGVAAMVNHAPISIAEYRTRLENVEQNARARFDQIPEAQRRMMMDGLKRRTLEDLIMGEIVYQEAKNKGVMAADGEVRDYILQIPFLQDNGRFVKDRYNMFLKNMNMAPADFERQVRKQIVSEKMQELFVGSATPSQEELKRSRQLATQKINLKFVEFTHADLAKPGFVSDADVAAFASDTGKAEIEKYYKDNEFETLFTETRAYQVTVEVWKLFGRDLNLYDHLRAQAYFGAWMYVANPPSNGFDILSLTGFPTFEDFQKLLEDPKSLTALIEKIDARTQQVLSGPTSWRNTMANTIRRANELSTSH